MSDRDARIEAAAKALCRAMGLPEARVDDEDRGIVRAVLTAADAVQDQERIPANEATLAMLAVNPRATVELSAEQWARVQEIQARADAVTQGEEWCQCGRTLAEGGQCLEQEKRTRLSAQAREEALREALEHNREDAEWFLNGESGLPFAEPYSCLRAIAERCNDALARSSTAPQEGER